MSYKNIASFINYLVEEEWRIVKSSSIKDLGNLGNNENADLAIEFADDGGWTGKIVFNYRYLEIGRGKLKAWKHWESLDWDYHLQTLMDKVIESESRITEYTISEHFLSALFNGDESGLDDSEGKALNSWLNSFNHNNGHWSYDDQESEFKRCEVTGLMSDCVVVQWVSRE